LKYPQPRGTMGIQWYSMTLPRSLTNPAEAGWSIDNSATFPGLPQQRSFHPHLLLGQQPGLLTAAEKVGTGNLV